MVWEVRASFPGGLSFTPQVDGSARIAGVPTEAGQFELPLVVLTRDGRAVETILSLEIRDATPLTIITAMLPPARIGSAYTAAIDARGGTDEGHVWTVDAEALPPGLTLMPNGARAELVGTPDTEGMFVFAIEVRDSAGSRAARTLSVIAEPATDQFRIRLPEPPGGVVDEPLDLEFEGENGQSPLLWRRTGDEIPGMTFESNASRVARLVGTPTTVGRYAISISAVDTDGVFANAEPTIIIASPLIIEAGDVPAGTVGAAHEHRITASEAGGEHRWTVTRGALPPGLSLTGEGPTARLAGVPSSSGTSQFTVEVLDRVGQRAEIEVEVLVVDPLSIVPPLFPTLVLGMPFEIALEAVGGRAPYTFEITSGVLPAGLALENLPARITGTAGAVRTFEFVLAVEDVDGRRATHAARITIGPSGVPLTILPPTVTPFRACVGGHITLETAGGSRFGHTWSVIGSLPPGLWLPTTGTPTTALGGVPRAPGSYSIGVRVEDSNGEQATVNFGRRPRFPQR